MLGCSGPSWPPSACNSDCIRTRMTTLPATNPAMRGVCGEGSVVDVLLPVVPMVSPAEGECAKSQC